MNIPSALLEGFSDPDHDMEVARRAIDIILGAKDADQIALLLLMPVLMIASRSMAGPDGTSDRADEDQAKLSATMLYTGVESFIPAIIVEMIETQNNFDKAYSSTLNYIHGLIIIIDACIREVLKKDPEGFPDDLLRDYLRRLTKKKSSLN